MIKGRIFLVTLLIVCGSTAKALTWDDLWLNPNEQGYKALKQNDFQQAATKFDNSEWQGVAYYRLKKYKRALDAFSKGTDATAFYNKGNTLALLGRYQEAIAAYDKSLTLNPSFDDARFNRDLLKKLSNSQPTSAPTPQITPPFKQNYKNQQNQSQPNANDNAAPQKTSQNDSQQEQNQQQQQDQRQQQSANTQTTPVSANPTSYQDQQQQQALQNINDDPGGLLQRKLQRDYEQSLQQGN